MLSKYDAFIFCFLLADSLTEIILTQSPASLLVAVGDKSQHHLQGQHWDWWWYTLVSAEIQWYHWNQQEKLLSSLLKWLPLESLGSLPGSVAVDMEHILPSELLMCSLRMQHIIFVSRMISRMIICVPQWYTPLQNPVNTLIGKLQLLPKMFSSGPRQCFTVWEFSSCTSTLTSPFCVCVFHNPSPPGFFWCIWNSRD